MADQRHQFHRCGAGRSGRNRMLVMLLFAVWDIALHGHALPLPARSREEKPTPAPQPAWQRREVLAMLGVTVATAVLSFAYLGDTTAPQNPLDATGTVLQETVTVKGCH